MPRLARRRILTTDDDAEYNQQVCDAGANGTSLTRANPYYVVLRWQAYVTVALAGAAAALMGLHGVISALLGGFCIISAGWIYALMVSSCKTMTVGGTLRTLVRAEASKIALIVFQLWLVLTTYQDVIVSVFFAAVFVAVLLYPLALLVRE